MPFSPMMRARMDMGDNAKRVIFTKYQELRDGRHKTLPRPLRDVFYANLLAAYNQQKERVAQQYISLGEEHGNKALGEALAEMQRLYADALRSYQEGVDVLISGGLVDEPPPAADSQPEPESEQPALPTKRKRAGGL